MPRNKRDKYENRDAKEFDNTSLRLGFHGKILHRDYSAHFFRWSFARRFIKSTDRVLEVGCGPELPLKQILFHNVAPRANHYVGVDINKLPATDHQRTTLFSEFNFVQRWKELPKLLDQPAPHWKGFDIAVNMEVIEHMKVEHGREMLKGIYALLKPGGALLLSTPVFDGQRHAANHIHEYTVPELQKVVEKVGFKVERRFGTFMDIKHIPDRTKRTQGAVGFVGLGEVADALGDYFDNDALSCIFAPLFPDQARNNLWVLRK